MVDINKVKYIYMLANWVKHYYKILIIILLLLFLCGSYFFYYSHGEYLNSLTSNQLPKGYLFYSDSNSIRAIKIFTLYNRNKKDIAGLDDLLIIYSQKTSPLTTINSIYYPNVNTNNAYLCFTEGNNLKTSSLQILNLSTKKRLISIDSSPGMCIANPSISNHDLTIAYYLTSSLEPENSRNTLVIQDLTHHTKQTLSETNYLNVRPSWSPDDLYLAITQKDISGNSALKKEDTSIWVISRDGQKRWKIGLGYSPTWSHDGKKIYCYLNEKNIISYILDKDYHAIKYFKIYTSFRPMNIEYPPIVDETDRFIFFYMAGSPWNINAWANSSNEFHYLMLYDMQSDTAIPLLQDYFPYYGFSYSLSE